MTVPLRLQCLPGCGMFVDFAEADGRGASLIALIPCLLNNEAKGSTWLADMSYMGELSLADARSARSRHASRTQWSVFSDSIRPLIKGGILFCSLQRVKAILHLLLGDEVGPFLYRRLVQDALLLLRFARGVNDMTTVRWKWRLCLGYSPMATRREVEVVGRGVRT